MNRARLILGLLAGALLFVGVLADRALKARDELASDLVQAEAIGHARLLAAQVRASLADLEEAAAAGEDRSGLRAARLALPLEAELHVEQQGLERKGVADLATAMGDNGPTASGLPRAIVAALAIGDSEGEGALLNRLLSGELAVLPADLPYLALVLGEEDEGRVNALLQRIAETPPLEDIPQSPRFRRKAGAGGVTGWARVSGSILRYDVSEEALLAAAETAAAPVEGSPGGSPVRLRLGESIQGNAPDGTHWTGVAVPGVPRLRLEVSVAEREQGTHRWVVWSGLLALFGLAVVFARGVVAEAQAVERERAFLAAVTHELRTPLATVRVLGETLAEGRGDAKEYGALVAQESERLDALVDGILALTRLDEAPEFADVEVRSLLADAVGLVQPRAKSLGVEVTMAAPDGEVFASWDGEAVRRAILGLLDNALRHGCQDGGRVSLSLSVPEGEASALVAVSDEGRGIALKDQVGLFGRFARRGATGGTGLGLHLVEQVARAHGGRVEFQTREGKGTTFSLHLPLLPPQLVSQGGTA